MIVANTAHSKESRVSSTESTLHEYAGVRMTPLPAQYWRLVRARTVLDLLGRAMGFA